MRRLVIGASAVSLALALGTAPATAQFAVGVGATMPSGDFGEYAKAGWMAGAAFNVMRASGGKIGVWLEGAYGSNGHEGEHSGKTNLMLGDVAAAYSFNPDASMSPFILGTVGYLNHSFSPDGGGECDDCSEGGLSFGGGGGVKFGKFALQARYTTASLGEGEHKETTAFITLMASMLF